MASLRIALLQLSSAGGIDNNLRKGLEACQRAAADGADIALFPEVWSSGYTMFDPDVAGAAESWAQSAIKEDSEFIDSHRRAAQRLGIAIGTTFFEAHPSGPHNAFVLIDRRGEIVLRYAKVHTCQFLLERACTPGKSFAVASLETAKGIVRVGAMICFDREFPESARILALQGAEIVLVPNACIIDDHLLAQLKTRAVENKLVIAMASYPAMLRYAAADGLSTNGRSVGISAMAYAWERLHPGAQQCKPREILLLEAGPEEGIFAFEIDLDELRNYRRRSIFGTPYRRPIAYGDLLTMGENEPFQYDPDKIIY